MIWILRRSDRFHCPHECTILMFVLVFWQFQQNLSWHRDPEKQKKKKHFLKKGEKNIRNLDSFHEISEKKQWKRIFQNGPLAEVKKALKKKAIEIRICEYWGERKNQSFPQKGQKMDIDGVHESLKSWRGAMFGESLTL